MFQEFEFNNSSLKECVCVCMDVSVIAMEITFNS